MKNLFLLIVFASFSLISFAQNSFYKGDTQVNLGFGLSDWGIPLYVGFDHAINRDITFGGQLSVSSYDEKWSGEDYNHTILGVSGNTNYHFNRLLEIPRNWDFYAGLNVGLYLWNTPSGYHGSHSSGLGLGAQVGGRYYFSKKVGINLELGGGTAFSDGKIGVTIKI